MRYRLRRRGIDHGAVAPGARTTSWEACEPVVLRSVIPIHRARPSILRALRMIARLRRGADLASRLPPLPRGFRILGTTVNTGDPLEIHKLHLSARGRELYIKVNWLSTYPRDGSLRLRFSFGAEVLDDWAEDPVASRASDRLFERVFPASRLVTHSPAILRHIRSRIQAQPRFVQRIVYSNAPGGGAFFHHDYVPRQAGVVYAQLAGATGWIALPKRTLARQIQNHTRRWRDTRALLDYLDAPNPDRLHRLINHSPTFTRRLAKDGWFSVLRPGDSILLPSRGWDDVAWHSIFTVGRSPNLALSFGIRRKENFAP
ncbi:MAG: hypothetical protein HY716_07220 [Planctomycetes bacterium]|nr:hypothetical protein [Planctomycetota bacterium]